MTWLLNLIGEAIALVILAAPFILIAMIIKAGKKQRTRKKNQTRSKPHEPTDNDISWEWDPKIQKYVPYHKDTHIKYNNNASDPEPKATPAQEPPEPEDEEIDFKKAYQARYLLTKHEWQEFKTLRDIANVKGYTICPKVRLLDIIEPIKGQKKYKTLFYKVQSKHVDFVICDQSMKIRAVIELDDSSHSRQDRKDRDHFVDEILRSVGYTVIHTYAVTPDILDLV